MRVLTTHRSMGQHECNGREWEEGRKEGRKGSDGREELREERQEEKTEAKKKIGNRGMRRRAE